ncbi:MAG: hypothetical protein ACYTFI_23265, partial [Planctomycetota bacterium]
MTDSPPPAEQSDFWRRFRTDPVAFARELLGTSPWAMQEDVLRTLAEGPRVAVAGGHAVGKGHVSASAMLWYLYSHRPSIVLSTAPTERQVKRLLWGELRRQWAASKLGSVGRMLGGTELRLAPDWYAFGFSTWDSNRFQGFHSPHMLVVIDEAAGVSREIFEAVDAVLTGGDARLLLIGNPTTRSGRFYEAFARRKFATLRIPCTAHPNVTGAGSVIPGAVTREWIEYIRSAYGKESAYYQSRVLAQFPKEDSDSLVLGEWSERAFAHSRGAPGVRSLGADIARFGSDSTVIVAAEGGSVIRMITMRKRDLVTVADSVRDAARAHSIPPEMIHVDDTGLGGGVTDMLRARGLAARGVRFGSAPRDKRRFANRKAEIFWHLRQLFEAGAVALAPIAGTRDGEILREQLGLLRVDYAEDGRIKIGGEPGP